MRWDAKIQTRSQVPTLWNTNIEVVQPWTAWYFSDVSTVKGRKGVDRPYLCVGVPKDSYIRKKSKGSGQLTTRIKYQTGQISCTPSVECIVGWTTCKMLLFCSKISGPILITPWLHDKKYQALHACITSTLIFRSVGAWERSTKNTQWQQMEE